MRSTEDHLDCAIIGAGMSGLTAADQLRRGGASTTILEQSKVVGGRMASFRMASEPSAGADTFAVFDHGAQYFTVRDDRFGRMVQQWMEAGIVREWSQGFATSDGSVYMDGLARFRGHPDMTAIPNHLAQRLDVRVDTTISKIQWQAPHWRITSEDGRMFSAGSLVLTPPVPISLGLLDTGGIELPADRKAILNRIEYEPCIAVLLLLNGPSELPLPGGMWFVGEPIAWMADNHLKGVSAIPGTITIHAGSDFSEDCWHEENDFIINELISAAGEWLDSDITAAQVFRWRNSKPFMTYPEPCMSIENPAPLIFVGDAFAGPRVEGAFLSGLAAAGALM